MCLIYSHSQVDTVKKCTHFISSSLYSKIFYYHFNLGFRYMAIISNKLNFRYLLLVFTVTLVTVFFGCGGNRVRNGLGVSGDSDLQFQERLKRPIEQSWAVWLADNKPLKEALEGDKHYLRGEFRKAFDEYRSAFAKVNSGEQYKILLRLVGCTYALGQPNRGLTELGDYIRLQGKDVSEVANSDSVLFGYGYLLDRDKKQAVSWFLKVIREGSDSATGSDPIFIGMAEEGIYRVVASSTAEEIAELQSLWPDNPVIASALRKVKPNSISTANNTKLEMGENDPLLDANLGSKEIVAILPLSGKFLTLGRSLQEGINLAFKNWPEYQLTVIDSEGNPEIAGSKLAEILRERSIGGIVGPLISDSADTVSSMIKDLNIPMIHFAKRDILGESRGLNTYRLGVTPYSQAISMIKTIKSIGGGTSRVALIDLGGEVDLDLAKGLESVLAQQGISIELRERYVEKNTDELVRIAKAIESSNVDTLVFAGSLEDASQLLNTISPSIRSQLALIGGASWYQPEKLLRQSRLFDNSYIVSPFNKVSFRTEVQEFIKNYRESYKKDPDFLAAQSFDATQLLLGRLLPNAAQMNQSRDYTQPESVVGVTGELIIRPYGEIERFYEVLRFKDGSLMAVQ
jgi:ABC-type branched-subunit amino acid transport system substrate-binding protein